MYYVATISAIVAFRTFECAVRVLMLLWRHNMKLSVIIPCFNEARTIREILSRVKVAEIPASWQKEIIVVDDGSGDETKAVLRTLLIENPEVRIIFKEQNGGKGSAVKAGLGEAEGDYLIIQDADLEYDPSEYPRLLAPLIEGKATAVFGSRILGNNVPSSRLYFYGGLLVSKVFNLAFGTHLSDVTTCYKVFPRALVKEIIEQPSNDFVFDAIELTHVIARRATIVEVPISYHSRTHREGKKISWSDGVKCVFATFCLRVGIDLPTGMRIARFIITGALAAAVNLGVLYSVTVYGHLWYLYSAVLGFIVAFIVSFLLSKFWTFGNRARAGTERQLILHLLVALGNLVINTILVYLFVEGFDLWYMLAQAVAAVLIAIESYFSYRWIYRRPLF